MKRLARFIVLFVAVTLACSRSAHLTATALPARPTAPPVPAEYQATYDELETTLSGFANSLPPSGSAPTFGTDLAYANGNIGETLLEPTTMTLVQTMLDQLLSLGVQGVIVHISFPLLEPDSPRSAEYLQFFKQVEAQVRQRNLKLLIESGPLFAGTAYSPVRVDWSKYTLGSFLQARQNQLAVIAREIKPDYLQIANEPTTQAMLTGFNFTPAAYAEFVRAAIQQIGHSEGMVLTAGAGTWEEPNYLDGLIGMPGLDAIDIHLYPLGRDAALLQRAYAAAQDANAHGQQVVISEAGLYKVRASELTTLGKNFTEIFGRDVFSFWEPLDEKFIQVITQLARAGKIELVSFFWTRNFFAYLDYDQYYTVPSEEINRPINQASILNVRNGTLSQLGEFYKNWIATQLN